MPAREPQYGPEDGVELPIPEPPAPGERLTDAPGRAADETELRSPGAPEGRTRSGFVALAGRPNVGKSTLVNAIVGRKVAIVSDKPQTTRRAIRGVCTGPDYQLVLVDLPGVQRPRDLLTERMQHRVEAELRDCDAVLFLVNLEEGIGPGDRWIAEALKASGVPVILVPNKLDRLKPAKLIKALDETNELGLEAEVFPISARYGDRIEELVDHLVAHLPEGPFYFDTEDSSDQRIETHLAELVREQVLRRTFQEVPHAVEVEVTDIERREDELLIVSAAIWVETESQQGILIGRGGDMVKRIGQAARKEIEYELGEHIHLDLKVRVRKNWRREDRLLDRLGID